MAHHGGLAGVGTALDIELPPDPGDLVRDGDPEPSFIRVEVLQVERHVPATVRITLPGVGEEVAR